MAVVTRDLEEQLSKAPSHVRDTVGKIVGNEEKLNELKGRWDLELRMIAATDGGYGYDIRSSGVVILFDGELESILKCNAAENSKFDTI